MTRDVVAVPVDAEALASALDRHDRFRVLRRIERMDRRRSSGTAQPMLTGLAIDAETTGRDPRRHEIIELAMTFFVIDGHGRIVETGIPRSWLEQPKEPICQEITRVTGLTDADVAGRIISDGEATGMLLGCDFAISHNAAFDRAFVERRLPLGAGRPWVCSLGDVAWEDEGFGKRDLTALLGHIGLFFDPHRAAADVNALLWLLDHPLESGGTVIGSAVKRARRRSWIVDAVDAPFSAKEVLRDRGYRWDADRRVWSAAVDDDAIGSEIGWAKVMLYGGRREPAVKAIDWTERYAERTKRC